MRGKSLLHRGSLTLEERYYGNARSFSDAQLRDVLPGFRPDWTHTDVTAPVYAESADWDPVARMQHIDLFTWLRGDILVKADKMTMANSLELRVPFLDPEVFAVASRLPVQAEDHPHHHQVRAAPRAGAHRSAACAQPPETGLPGADPALAARRRAAGWAYAMVDASAGRPPGRQSPRCAGCSTNTEAAQRSQPPAVDGADLHAVARDLRRAQRGAADQRAAVPSAAIDIARPASG